MSDPIEDLATELLDAAVQVGDENRLLAPGGGPQFIESAKRLFKASTELSERLHPELDPCKMQPESKIHRVKCWSVYFAALLSGIRTFDIRRNDRNYQAGDLLVSLEFDPWTRRYSGEMVAHRITYVLALEGDFFDGVFPIGFVVMSLKLWSIPRNTEEQIRGELR